MQSGHDLTFFSVSTSESTLISMNSFKEIQNKEPWVTQSCKTHQEMCIVGYFRF